MKKTLTMILAFALVFALGVGGTLAWLTDSTEEVVNTFTPSNIDITLEESVDTLNDGAEDFKMVPGSDITKDPVVTVVGGSEACWLFIKVVESDNLDDFIDYAIINEWKPTTTAGIYYREVTASENDQEFPIIVEDTVTVLEDVTKDMMDDLEDGTATNPTLTFKAAAVQHENVDTLEAAMEKLPSAFLN